jgi:hypothetical protein
MPKNLIEEIDKIIGITWYQGAILLNLCAIRVYGIASQMHSMTVHKNANQD